MNAFTREQRRTTFDDVAELYERVRPDYPERLVDDVVWLSGLPPAGRILEIGAGTGKATLPFARRGYPMLCLEPGSRMAAVAAPKLANFPEVRIEGRTFEDWGPPRGDLDLVMAAQSFHFVDPAIGLPKVAAALRPGGAVALFGYRPRRDGSPALARLQQAYARHAPELLARDAEPPIEERIDATGLFGTVVRASYQGSFEYSVADYVALMETQSNHRLLPADRRERLLAAIGDVITELGGTITIEHDLELKLARRRATG